MKGNDLGWVSISMQRIKKYGALGRPRGMVWGGRRVQDGEHMYTYGGFILIYGKINTLL